MNHFIIIIFIFIGFFPSHILAAEKKNKNDNSSPIIIKADQIIGDKNQNIIDAIGNAEVIKDEDVLLSDKISYEKDNNLIKAFGDVRINNYKIGNLVASYADIKDDLTIGHFDQATIIFNNGAYIKSPKITRTSKTQTILTTPLFSICPSPDIAIDNDKIGKKRDFISVKSKKAIIDQTTETMKLKGAFLNIYNLPILYSPYLSLPMPSTKRKSGFLPPSYTSTSKLGTGIKIPYYFNIAANKDLTTTTEYHPIYGDVIVYNKYRHLLKQGDFDINLELANNKTKKHRSPNDTNPIQQDDNIRWLAKSRGDFKLSDQIGLEFDIYNFGDRDYMRDYHNTFLAYTQSTVDLNYIEGRNYYSAKTMRIQELENDRKQAPLALPILTSYIESKPGQFNENYSLLSNSTIINRESGLQYRRFSAKPTVKIPYNIDGNLFTISAAIQGDIYNLESNFADENQTSHSDYENFQTNYRPETQLFWSLPMITKFKGGSLILEPMANFVASSYHTNSSKIPNEDSSNKELTQNNLFLSNRLLGYDRNESGQRVNYGFKSSLFSSLGQFGAGFGQGQRMNNKRQDVKLVGFSDDDKSNIVGEISYKSEKIFDIIYNFQLNESSYRNDVNEIMANFNFNYIGFGINYLFLRKTADSIEREQISLSSDLKLTKRLILGALINNDLVLERTIMKKYTLTYNGCCLAYQLFVAESNPGAFVKPEKSYGVIFTIQNF